MWDRGGNVLIIGIGTGADIDAISPEPGRVIEGVDISEKMIEICHEKHPTTKLHRADFVKFNDFAFQPYGLIICSGTLEFIECAEAFFVKSAQLLSSDGV